MKNILKKIIKKGTLNLDKDNKYKDNFKELNIIFIILYVWKRINKKRKFQTTILFILMVISGFSEFLAFSSVIPFLTAITDPNKLIDYKFITFFYNFFNFTDNKQLIYFTTFIFLFMIYFSALMRISNLLINYKLTAAIGSELSFEAYKKTLYQPYSKHLGWNSSVIVNIICKDINTTVQGLSHSLIILNSLIITSSILVGLLIVNTKIAITLLSIVVVSYFFIGYKNRILIEKNGYIITKKSEQRIKSLQEGLGAIKEILLGNNQKYYAEIFKSNDVPIRKLTAKNSFLGSFPKYLLETIGITFIALTGAVITNRGLSSEAISLVGFIALGSQRLLPGLQNIYSSWITLKASKASIINVLNLLNQQLPIILKKDKIKAFEKFIEFKDVSFRYETDKILVLDKLNFRINFGEKIGIIGKTGSGKSTTIDLLMTLIEPSQGQILIDGKDVFNDNAKNFQYNWRSQITHVPQVIYLSDNSLYENIAFGEQLNKIDISRVKKAASKAQIAEFIESCPQGYKTVVGERGIRLSGGQRQRIALARAFYKNNKFFILDEATSALDSKTEKLVIESIYNLGPETTLIMISHRLSTLKNCSKILKFESGSIIEYGDPKNILK